MSVPPQLGPYTHKKMEFRGSSVEQHVVNQGPFAVLFTGMIILGSVINKNATDTIVHPKDTWCENLIPDLEKLLTTMPVGLGAATVIVVLIFPLIPVLLNSQTKKWNNFKIQIVKCHVMGQGSAFGVAELLRHIMTFPAPTFLTKCNITTEECRNKTTNKLFYPLFTPTPATTTPTIATMGSQNVTSFCHTENSPDRKSVV